MVYVFCRIASCFLGGCFIASVVVGDLWPLILSVVAVYFLLQVCNGLAGGGPPKGRK